MVSLAPPLISQSLGLILRSLESPSPALTLSVNDYRKIFIVCANLGLYTLAAPFWYVLKRHVQASDQMNRERKRAEHVAKATTVTNEERADASTSASQQGATETVASDASPASNLAFAVPLRAVSDHVLNSAIQCISMSPLHGPDAAVKELEWVQRHQKTSGVPVRLSSHSFTPVLKAYSQRRPADLVHMRAFFNSMPLKAIVAYAIMFDAYVDGGKASDARDLLDLMRARQVPINSYTISSFLKLILSQAKRASPRSPEQQLLIDEAEQQWSHAKADHVTMLERGSVTSAMIKLYYDLDDRLDDSRVRRQIAIFDEALAIEATAMTDDAPADYVQVKCITTLLASFQRSRTPHIWREEATRLIQLTFDRAAQADRDLAAHNTSAHATRQRRLQIDPGLCFAMVSYLQECHLHTELFDVWSRLTPSQKSRDAFRPAFRACTFMSDAARAEKLMTEYERLFSRQPDVDYYISWLLCFEGSGDIDGADRVWLRMIDAGVHPSAQTLTSRARVYLRRATRQPETAAALEEVLDSILDQIAVELRASSAAVAATSAAPLAGMARRANSAKMKRIMQRCDQLAAEARHQKK